MLDALATPDVIVVVVALAQVALLVEAANPGMTVPGAAGVALLVLAGALLSRTPANDGGLALMFAALVLLGFVQRGREPMAAAYGGTLLLMLGALVAFDDPGANRWVLTAAATTAGVGSVVAARTARRIRYGPDRRPVHDPADHRGQVVTIDRIGAGGPQSKIDGQWWTLEGDRPLQVGERVRITSRQGLTLRVDPLEEPPCPRQ